MEKTFGELMEVVEKRRSYSVHAILITKKPITRLKQTRKLNALLFALFLLCFRKFY